MITLTQAYTYDHCATVLEYIGLSALTRDRVTKDHTSCVQSLGYVYIPVVTPGPLFSEL